MNEDYKPQFLKNGIKRMTEERLKELKEKVAQEKKRLDQEEEKKEILVEKNSSIIKYM